MKYFLLFILCFHIYYVENIKLMSEISMQEMHQLHTGGKCKCRDQPEPDSKPPPNARFTNQNLDIMKIINIPKVQQQASDSIETQVRTQMRTLNKFPGEEFRFAYGKEESEIALEDQMMEKAKWGGRFPYWLLIPFIWASASSFFIWWPWWWCWWCIWIFWPAFAFVRYYWSAWISRGFHKKDDVQWWKGGFYRLRRVNHFWIVWIFSPGKYKFLYSPDNKEYTNKDEQWKDTRGLWVRWLIKRFWWWRYYYCWHIQLIHKEEPYMVKSIKIEMKDPMCFFFGIYQIWPWTRRWNVLLQSQVKTTSPECLTVADGTISKDGALVVVQDCIEAISQLDGREFWVYETSMQISHFKTGKCLETAGGDVRDGNRIQIWNCFMTQMTFDNRDKWFINQDYRISSLKDENMCLMATADPSSSNLAKGSRAHASSTIPDTVHKAQRIIDGTDSYWASAPGDFPAVVSIFFDGPRTARNVKIFWQYPPEEFEVSALTAVGGWMIVSSVQGNSAMQHIAQMGVRTIFGVKVNCLKHHPTLGKFRDKHIFGIKKIEMDSGAKSVKLKKCSDGEEGKATNWNLIESYYYNDWAYIPYVQTQKLMFDNVMNVLPPLNSLIALDPLIKKAKNKGEEHLKVLEEIEEQLKDIDIRLTIYKSYLDKPPDTGNPPPPFNVGASPGLAAPSCASIMRRYPSKFSGFYWVKPTCGTLPLRVFCDFQIHNNAFYAYFGSVGDGPPISTMVKSVEDIAYQCAKIGLEPLEIKNRQMIKNLLAYLNQIGIQTKKEAIPLGFDWSCKKQCSGRYSSLNSEQSEDVTAAFSEFKDNENLMNQKFTSGAFGNKDTAGIGLASSGIMFYPFSELPVKGIVCSANKEVTDDEVKADCFTMLRANEKLMATWHTQFKVKCPPGCADVKAAEIWGETVYRDDSSICRAAIHAGAIKGDESEIILMSIEYGKPHYGGSKSNGIESLQAKGHDLSFIVNKYSEKCPIDFFKKKASSFLQISGEPDSSDIQNYIMGIEDLKKKSEEIANSTNSSMSSMPFSEILNFRENNTYRSPVQNSTNEVKSYRVESPAHQPPNPFGEDDDDDDDDDDDEEEDGEGEGGEKTAFGLFDKKKKEKKKKKKKDEKKKKKKKEGGAKSAIQDNDDAKGKLAQIYMLDYRVIRKVVKLVKDSHKLIEFFNSKIIPILSSNMGPDAINRYLDEQNKHMDGGTRYQNKLLIKANARVKENERILMLLELEKTALHSFGKYVEEYTFPIPLAYEIFDHPDVADGPSNWKTIRKSMQGHEKTISQTSRVSFKASKSGGASYCVLRYRKYYDTVIKVAFLAAESGTFGVVFRFKSPFDHYLLELSAEKKTKSLKKIKNGNAMTLIEKEDGGYLQAKWNKIIIKTKQSLIDVFFGDEGIDDDKLENLFGQVDDQEFALGRIGFMVNGVAGLFLDKFEIDPTNCIVPKTDADSKDAKGKLKSTKDGYNFDYIEPPECSRFRENYFGQMELRWRHRDALRVADGPGKWEFAPGKKGAKKVIFQSTNVKSSGPDQGGSILEFIGEKLCIDGSIMVDFYGTSDGVVGLAFRYRNRRNHYLVEVAGGVLRKLVRVRKVVDGKYSILAQKEGLGYDVEKWYTLRVSFKGEKILVFYYEKGKKPEDVLPPVDDDELKEGTWGLTTFLTPAMFDNIKVYPNSDILDDVEDRSSSDAPDIMDAMRGMQQMRYRIDMMNFKGQGVNNTNIKTRTFDQCITFTDIKGRQRHCKEMFDIDPESEKHCADNYCNTCCERFIDHLHFILKYKCKKQCEDITKPEDDKDFWWHCIESDNPKRSIYHYCELDFREYEERKECKIDFCHLCCITVPDQSKILMKDESMVKCEHACIERYTDKKDIIID